MAVQHFIQSDKQAWQTSDERWLARKPGDPLPRLILDGMALIELGPAGLCRDFSIWWHSMVDQ